MTIILHSLKTPLFITLFSLAVLAGGAYNTYYHFDFSHSPDTKSYLQMAKGNYAVNITHRYRFVVPLLAGAVTHLTDTIFPVVWKNKVVNDWSLRFSFFIVNTWLMCLTAYFLYEICRFSGASFTASLVGILAFLTSRWAWYTVGLPYIDSLYLLCIGAFVYGILTKMPSVIFISICFGPLAKESFWLFVPLLFLFQKDKFVWNSVYTLISAALFLLARYCINYYTGALADESLTNAINHFDNIQYSLIRMASVKGIGEILFVFGGFNCLLFFQKPKLPTLLWMVLPVVALHILLSGDVGRMLFVSAPFFCAAFARGFDALNTKYQFYIPNS